DGFAVADRARRRAACLKNPTFLPAYSASTAISTLEKTTVASAQKKKVSRNASPTGNQNSPPGDLKLDLSTAVPSIKTGTIYAQRTDKVRLARAGNPSTKAAAPAARNGCRKVENIRATVPANTHAATRQSITNQT